MAGKKTIASMISKIDEHGNTDKHDAVSGNYKLSDTISQFQAVTPLILILIDKAKKNPNIGSLDLQ